MESGSFAGDPRAATQFLKFMLRALVVCFAMWAVGRGTCSAQTGHPAAGSGQSPCQIENRSTRSLSAHDAAQQKTSAAHSEDSAAESELLQLANESRKLAGAAPLRMEKSLNEAALLHARLMIASRRLDHQFPDEAGLFQRIADSGSVKMDRAGENLALATCAPSAHDLLMHSPPHRQNLLDREFNIAGIAAIWSEGKLYVVQDFAREVPSYSAHETDHLVGQAIAGLRQQEGLPQLTQRKPAKLDDAACNLASGSRPNAHLLATAYENRKIITYTQSRPEVLPSAALNMLRDSGISQFAVGACFARNSAYPSGTYWVAILLY
jgi:uncharacterized protein YkwD